MMGLLNVRWRWTLGCFLLAGCCGPLRERADSAVCDLAAHPLDLSLSCPADASAPASAATVSGGTEAGKAASAIRSIADPAVLPAAGQQPEAPRAAPPLSERLRIPPELPGANTPPLQLPSDRGERERVVNQYFPPLPPLGPDPDLAPGPEGHPLTLADLQRLALANSPLIRQAAADVEAARGAAEQAGAYPNPNVGYEADTAGTGGTAGYQGAFVEQVIKTGGKLKLAQAAAEMDLRNAEIALRRAQTDLAAQVRGGYFAVLVAQENLRMLHALARLMDEVYRIQVVLFRDADTAAAYEPFQLRVQVGVARAALMQARNNLVVAWKQLAATLGLPALPPTQLAGRADMPFPVFHYDAALAHVLRSHTDVRAAQVAEQRARYNLRLAQMTPVPDLDVRLVVQKDYTMPPFSVVHTVQVGAPLPLWDRNQGGIYQAQGALLRAVEQAHQVRDDLTSRLADAFGRYETNRLLVEYYRRQILPDQVIAYRGVYLQHQVEPAQVNFGNVVSAQQTLGATLTTYVTTLGALWTAVVDVANLLQTDDLFAGAEETCPGPALDLEKLLPCSHPCTPLRDPGLKGLDGSWPPPSPVPPEGPKAAGAAPAKEPAPKSSEPGTREGAAGGPASTPAAANAPSGAGPASPPPGSVAREPAKMLSPAAEDSPAAAEAPPRWRGRSWRQRGQE